jgi:hypothetical protein
MATGVPRRRMSSRAVHLGALGALGAALAACSSQAQSVIGRCVEVASEADGAYRIAASDLCGSVGSPARSTTHIWYFGGAREGDRVSGGGTVRPLKTTIVDEDGQVIYRGGFGYNTGTVGS